MNTEMPDTYWLAAEWWFEFGLKVVPIVDNQLLILDADSPEAIGALYATEEAFDLTPNLVVTTRKGEHHYFKRALGTYAHMDSFNTENEPEKIDIRTGRQSDSGRSIIILPPRVC